MASETRSSIPIEGEMSQQTNRYIHEILHAQEAPPPIAVRYFYTSPLAIDDPLSPLPPPASSQASTYKQPPRPFSQYDNQALDKAWLELRQKILKDDEEGRGEKGRAWENKRLSIGSNPRAKGSKASSRDASATGTKRRSLIGSQRGPHPLSDNIIVQDYGAGDYVGENPSSTGNSYSSSPAGTPGSGVGSLKVTERADLLLNIESSDTTGTPFIRAPSRTNVSAPKSRPGPSHLDSYEWDEEFHQPDSSSKDKMKRNRSESDVGKRLAKVPVGISRLHEVVMDENPIRMEPIYWRPVNDIAAVIRGTWFYTDTMLPVEVEVANMLEAGYVSLRPWTETWNDELNSAVEVGAIGEMKILHRLWPEKSRKPESRPGTSRDGNMTFTQSSGDEELDTPEKRRAAILEHSCDLIDIATGPNGPDNKACGSAPYGRDGKHRIYHAAGIIYANAREAYILKPNLQPSEYYGRRPLANYIRRGRPIGIRVVRGFDDEAWNKLHPPKKGTTIAKAREGVSTAQASAPTDQRRRDDPTIAQSERPDVTDLVLVIHGIGQKLSERIESYHFTHAINALRREVNVELGTDSVKVHLRPDCGGIMVLPVNWRLSLSFEDGGYREESDDPGLNKYTLKDITPETLPSVRNIISDVMLDIPYYLSNEHSPKMVAACIGEANRVYRLWCANNPGFSEWGRVHIIAHSLGSVMAVDILSHQPSSVPKYLGDPRTPESDLPADHFIFDTKSLFVAGSPVGFFLLLKRAQLLPRRDRSKPGADGSSLPGVAGEQDTYGCLAVDNIYNIINGYDPVAYCMNATVDAAYAAALKPAFVPSASASIFSLRNPFKSSFSSAEAAVGLKNPLQRLPSTVELETHNFTREEIAEKRAYLLNDNGQIDYFLKYGGGALEIQYLTMLGAHSSYWLSQDFVRMIVVEVGRRFGKEGTILAMRAQKKKVVVTDR